LSTGEIAYLTLVLGAFAVFAASLWVLSRGRHDEPPAAPGD
jgi:hypothetical protein